MESTFYGMTTMDLRRAAYDFAEGNNINHPFNRTTRLAGKDWVLDFARRHRLSVRTPQSTSMNRVVAFDREKVAWGKSGPLGHFCPICGASVATSKFLQK